MRYRQHSDRALAPRFRTDGPRLKAIVLKGQVGVVPAINEILVMEAIVETFARIFIEATRFALIVIELGIGCVDAT